MFESCNDRNVLDQHQQGARKVFQSSKIVKTMRRAVSKEVSAILKCFLNSSNERRFQTCLMVPSIASRNLFGEEGLMGIFYGTLSCFIDLES